MTASTSFRISESARAQLAGRASAEGISATSLLERLIQEGIDSLDNPGIVFRGPAHDRRAALAAGPDVWEIVGRLQELRGGEEQRIATLCEETDLTPRLVRLALDYAASHADQVMARIERNRLKAEQARHAIERRQSILA